MSSSSRGVRPLVLLAMVGCLPPVQAVRTVEPPPAIDSEPQVSSGLIAAATVSDTDGGMSSASSAANDAGLQVEQTGTEADSEFVQSRRPQRPTPQDVKALPIHLREAWWPFRAEFLGISPADAKRRDAAFAGGDAPKDFWDEQTAVEAVSVWTVLCNECHGGRRSVRDALATPAPAPGWGKGDGIFFGNRRSYRHVFDIVSNGGPPQNGERSEMIAWRKELSREQIWALLYFLEYQSGGVLGRFAPSLYPRRTEALGNL